MLVSWALKATKYLEGLTEGQACPNAGHVTSAGTSGTYCRGVLHFHSLFGNNQDTDFEATLTSLGYSLIWSDPHDCMFAHLF